MRLKLPIIACFILIATVLTASAHDWYPIHCCSGHDCHPIPCESILEQGKDLVYNSFHFFNDMIKPSQDGMCHVCIGNEFKTTGDFSPVPHCIFIQQGS